MAHTPNKVQYFKRGETGWELFYFETSADQIAATGTHKVPTIAQLNLIDNFLNVADFNTAGRLVELDENAKIPVGLLPSLSDTYLTKSNPTFTGTLDGNNARFNFISAYNSTNDTLKIANRGQDQSSASIILRAHNVSGQGEIELKAPAGIKFDTNNGVINVSSSLIRNLAIPEQTNDAATKGYVDNKVSSGFTTREPVKAASVNPIDIDVALNSLDGISLSANDRVLIKNQTTASQNGVYKLDSTKKPVKVTNDSKLGSAVFVEYGDTNNDYIYHCSTENTWVAFSKPDTVKAGSGLEKTGTTLSVAAGGITNSMIQDNTISLVKFNQWGLDDNFANWSAVESPQTSASPINWLNGILSAIKLLRGTAKYNTSNSQTIAGAYSNAAAAHTAANNAMAAIPTIGVGTALPTSGMKEGDLFFLKK